MRRDVKFSKMYWRNNDRTNILRPNGFNKYPEELYNLFLEQIEEWIVLL